MSSASRRPAMRASRYCFVAAGTVFVALAGACNITGPGDLDDLREARALWVSQGITDYAYVLQRGCFCTLESIGPVTITVRGGVVESLVYVPSGEPVTMGGELWPTMNGLFDLIERAVDGGADEVATVFHADLGYPLTAEIDYIEQAIDDELTLTVSSFTPLVTP